LPTAGGRGGGVVAPRAWGTAPRLGLSQELESGLPYRDLAQGELGMPVGLHERLVEELAGKGLLDNPRLRATFQAVRRERFLPGVDLDVVYRDEAVTTQVGPGGMTTSSSSQPSIMAMMLAQLDPQPGDRVLEIGAGTGYNAALLARLVGPKGQVTTVDIDPAITQAARANLARTGMSDAEAAGVEVHTGDGWLGAADRGPFDRVQVTVGVWDIAPAWTAQLALAGTLVVPLWLRAGVHVVAAFARLDGDRLASRQVAGCEFVRLRGPHAGPAAVVEVRPGLLASVDQVDTAHLALLRELLSTRPAHVAAPPVPRGMGWFGRLALEQPDPIQLLDQERDEVLLGLFDPTLGRAGLALLRRRDGQLVGFGDQSVLARLRGHLTRGASLDFRALAIEAIPADTLQKATPGDAQWVLSRPAHRFLIR
jgi:protein-L-isoaspartate(D-aspartate) O-methyltransferase